MKKNYTEKYIIGIIEDRIFPKAPEEAKAFSLKYLVAGSILKRNGADFRVDCALDVNDEGIFVAFIEDVHSDKEVVFHSFKFSEIQGIKVKSRKYFYNVTLQFIDGRNYVFEFVKQSTKQLPNQGEQLESFISILQEKNLHDMDNIMHKQHIKSNRKMAFSYIITLVIFLIAAMFYSVAAFPNNMFWMIISIIVTGMIHFVFFMLGTVFLYTRKDRPFTKEFNRIMDEYNENSNVEDLLTKLSNMNNKPGTRNSKNTFYLTKSTALHENNRTEEALLCLDDVQTTNEKEIDIIETQRRMLEGVES